MAAFLFEYGLFLAKLSTLLIAVLLVVGFVASRRHGGEDDEGRIEVRKINDRLDALRMSLREALLEPDQLKREHKAQRARDKREAKARRREAKLVRKRLGDKAPVEEAPRRANLFVLDFDGDIRASATDELRREISAVLAVARSQDEVVLRLESPGGLVHGYGLAASQLDRIRAAKVPLTVCVDKVAASGGYMMASVANKIIAAPFAVLGSIGVVAQLPNFHRLLKDKQIDIELFTAGEFKRTLTVLGENTEAGRRKFAEEIEDTHALFKAHVGERRPQLDIEAVATGETWFGTRALERQLVDRLATSDEYLIEHCAERDIFEVRFAAHKSLREKLGLGAVELLDAVALRCWSRLRSLQLPH